jgi:hypothetical protein
MYVLVLTYHAVFEDLLLNYIYEKQCKTVGKWAYWV